MKTLHELAVEAYSAQLKQDTNRQVKKIDKKIKKRSTKGCVRVRIVDPAVRVATIRHYQKQGFRALVIHWDWVTISWDSR
jgi:hypothetical protein